MLLVELSPDPFWILRSYQELLPGFRGDACCVDVPAGERHGWGDYFALSVVGAAFVDGADLIYGVRVAGGNQLVIFSEQAFSSGEGAELVAGVEAEAVHGVIGLFAGAWSWLGAGGRR